MNEVIAAGSSVREANGQALDLRDRVVIGLRSKLIIVLNVSRRMQQIGVQKPSIILKHWLKTYIYFQWARDETRAKLLLAKGCQEKLRFFKANSELDPDNSSRQGLDRALRGWTLGLEQEWKQCRKKSLEKNCRGNKSRHGRLVRWSLYGFLRTRPHQ